jgi:hypothetical protein
MARPREWDRAELLEKLLHYVDNTDIPILARFAYEHGVDRQRLYEWPELADALKNCIAKKEAALEEGALTGMLNVSMAIFSLKQLGWSDRQEVAVKGAIPLELKGSDVHG